MDALDLSYVRLASGKIRQSLQIADDVVADFDEAGGLLGVEFLSTAAAARRDEYIALARSGMIRERLSSGV